MKDCWKAAGAAAWGAVGFGGLLPFMTEGAQRAVETLCPGAQTVFVAAFSYFAGDEAGNLALYCRGADYHGVLKERLEGVCTVLRARYPQHRFVAGTDASPIPERQAAVLAGLGACGQHGLLILPPYGSYLFLGTIVTDLPWRAEQTAKAEAACTRCGACLRACPTGALGEGGLDASRCLSAISQRKGALTEIEQRWLAQSPLIWGCDLCQRACPHNRHAQKTSLPAFLNNRLCSLHPKDLEGLTQRQFQERYGARAFAWRGIAPLRRNLLLHPPADQDRHTD